MQNLAYNRGLTGHLFPYSHSVDFLNRNAVDRPVFLYSKKQLQQTSKAFQRSFPGEVSYAVKANPEKAVLDTLWNSGIRSFDVASIGEIELLHGLFPSCKLHYNNPIRSPEMVGLAYKKYGVRSFVVDDLAGLENLVPFCNNDTEVTIRFKLNHESAAYDFGSKFGCNVKDGIELLAMARKLTIKTSMTFHPGSQCTDPGMYERYIQTAAVMSVESGVDLYRLNVGGGFPVAYEDAEVSPLKIYFDRIVQAMEMYFSENKPKLMCEPGRAMVSASTSLMTQVNHVRGNGDVFINDGVYGGLQEQSIMQSEMPIKVWRDGIILDSQIESRTIFGPTCDPVDKLSTAFPLPKDIQIGDHIEFGFMGAYGSATATEFNGFESAQYISVLHGFFES